MKHYTFDDCLAIVRRLRSPNGCPWDNEQTLESVLKYFQEEVYEALDAADRRDWPGLTEELGDVLWEILFLARIAEQEDHFTMEAVLQILGEKMVRRHPHIFGDARIENSDQVLAQWSEIKKQEKKTATHAGVLTKVPGSLPALLRSYRLSERAASVGFDWENAGQVWAKVEEEKGELAAAMAAGDRAAVEHELGDLIFALVNLGRHLEINAEDAVRRAANRFVARFEAVEATYAGRGEKMADKTIAELEAEWQAAKKRVG
ncbi:MAG: nucleoside triphosphate pyrophosphohydrolase [Myxococcales bacterium]|nr:nucleoside triphosphate pyrophosphohydrolase [Myxococcales bacterium]